jgi:hypothetical protein
MMFQFLNNDYFPAGLSISQSFLPNDQGLPGMIASVFGASLNPDGSIRRNGGIAYFANVRQLIEQFGKDGLNGVEGEAETLSVEGVNAHYYNNNPAELSKLEDNLIRGFQGLKPRR